MYLESTESASAKPVAHLVVDLAVAGAWRRDMEFGRDNIAGVEFSDAQRAHRKATYVRDWARACLMASSEHERSGYAVPGCLESKAAMLAEVAREAAGQGDCSHA